jgi:probable rRNA maturation factor
MVNGPDKDQSVTSGALEIEIIESNEQWSGFLEDIEAKTSCVIRKTLQCVGYKASTSNPTEIAVSLSSDAEVRTINQQHRNQDKTTNVLSFPSFEREELDALDPAGFPAGMPVALGDVIIAFETVAREASEQGKPFSDHYYHLIAHGCLHLLGYDHETDEEAEEMEAIEVTLLAELGIANPYESTL